MTMAIYKYEVNLAPHQTMQQIINEICAACILMHHTVKYLKHEGQPFLSCTETAAAELIASANVPSITHLQQLERETA